MEQTREARLMDWMERYSQAILRTCFVYLGCHAGHLSEGLESHGQL